MVSTGLGYNLRAHGFLHQHGFAQADLAHLFFQCIGGVCYAVGLLMYPDGSAAGKRRLRNWPLALGVGVVTVVVAAILEEVWQVREYGILLFGGAILFVAVAAQWYRSQYAQSARVRKRAKALLWAVVAAAAVSLLVALVYGFFAGMFANWTPQQLRNTAWLEPFLFLGLAPLLAGIPIVLFLDAIGGGERVVKGMVWLAISLYIGLVYSVASVFVDQVLRRETGGFDVGEIAESVVITVLIVLSLERFKETFEHRMKELVLGDEYHTLAELMHRLLGVTSGPEVLEYASQTAGMATHAAWASIELTRDHGQRDEARWTSPDKTESDRPEAPVRYDETIDLGNEEHVRTRIGRRSRWPLGKRQQKLLADLVAVSILAYRATRVTEQLQHELLGADETNTPALNSLNPAT
jgi:hypothetical protein